MNAFQARMFIEQILAQPSVPAAAQVVQANLGALDAVFFLVLQQMIQAEQPDPGGSWGGSMEDRIAEGMARLGSPVAPSQRLQALCMLQNYAGQLCQQQMLTNLFQPAAPPPPPVVPQPAPAKPPPLPPPLPPPQGDLAKVQKLMALDRRYLPLLADIMPGRATPKTITELETLREDYERLAAAGPPDHPFYTPKDLRGKIADVLESIARTQDSLNRVEEARDHYQRALQAWAEIGQPEKVRRCETALARLRLSTEGNVDAEIQRLQSALEETPSDTLAHVQNLVELAELQSGGGDDFAADELLMQAREEMTRMGYGTPTGPSGIDLAGALEDSVRAILSGQGGGGPTPIETQMQARGLQRRILFALAQICRDSDPAKANGYLQQAKQMDGKGEKEAFSQEMLSSLGSLFNPPDKPPRLS